MSQYVVFQVYNPTPEAAQNPLPLMGGYLVEADDEASAVELIVELGIFTTGTTHALAIEPTQSFDVTVHPTLKPAEIALAPGPPIELGPGDAEQIPIPIPIEPES